MAALEVLAFAKTLDQQYTFGQVVAGGHLVEDRELYVCQVADAVALHRQLHQLSAAPSR